jgi:GTP-binding protein
VIKIFDAQFVTTAVAPDSYPPMAGPEVAFVGRSNVGKSSMINALAQRRKLVRVSNTPGRTRTLNFFDVDLELDGTRRVVRLCDLPGYGFAKASKEDRRSWEEMITTYLKARKALKVVVSIIDSEIGPTPDDHQTLGYLSELGDQKILVAATKIDRIPKAKRKPRLAALSEELELDSELVVPFSATEGIGVEEVWRALLQAMFR